jgi:cytochrome c oxidase subunit IV
MDHGHATAKALPQQVHHDSKQGQQHPLGIYFVIWGLLFVLSAFSYSVDYFGFHGLARWSLILLFMWLKAGLIVAVFMHMRWERSPLMYAILVPPLLLAVLVSLMSIESDYTFWTRILFFGFK